MNPSRVVWPGDMVNVIQLASIQRWRERQRESYDYDAGDDAGGVITTMMMRQRMRLRKMRMRMMRLGLVRIVKLSGGFFFSIGGSILGY